MKPGEEEEEGKEEGEEGEAANLEEMPSFPPVVNIGVSNSIVYEHNVY